LSTWYTEKDLRKADLIWLLDLTLGGASYLFATESISIDSDDGARFYDGTLTGVNVSSELEFATPDFEMPSASCQVTFRIDLAKRIAQGVDLGSATAEISLFRKDTDDDYDDRAVVLRGRVDTGSYGAIGEPVNLNIEADFLRSSRQLPDPSAVIDSGVNWPNSEDNVQGLVYPVIIGSPGRQGFAGSPIYVIEDLGSGDRKGLLAGHPCTASTVNVIEIQPDGTRYVVTTPPTILTDKDSNGLIYSYVNIPNAHFTADNSFFAQFDQGGGGLINPFATAAEQDGDNEPGTLTGAGDLLRYLLRLSGVTLDDGRTAAAAQMLNVYEIDAYIGEVVDIMRYIKDELLPLLPCSLRASADGIYPVVWRYDATADDAKAHLTADTDIYRDGPVEYVGSDVFNEITINYRHNCRYNKLRKKLTVTGDANKQKSGFLWSNDYTLGSAMRYGIRSMEIDTELISSRATAGRVINWMSRAYSQRHRVLTYSAPVKLGYLEIGDIVALTDAELSLSDQVVLIQAIEYDETNLLITFLMIPDTPRDTIPTG
jgi:hypothetical protein